MWTNDPYVIISMSICSSILVLSALSRALAVDVAPHPLTRATRGILRQAVQAAQASQQDVEAQFALQHATQALAYVEIAMQLVDTPALQRVAPPNTDVLQLAEKLKRRQASLLRRIGLEKTHGPGAHVTK